MIKEGSRVQIVGAGKRAWFYPNRREYYGLTGVVEVFAKRKGCLFNVNLIMDKIIPAIGIRDIGCISVKLKELK